MTLGQIKERLQSSEYDFLRTDEHLGHHIILLTLGGSHAYGTSMETSDLDIRGCALNSKREILIHEDFGQVTDPHTDTTIYAFRKLIPRGIISHVKETLEEPVFLYAWGQC